MWFFKSIKLCLIFNDLVSDVLGIFLNCKETNLHLKPEYVN